MMVMQVIISICTGVMSPLVWSMYADVSDYAELEYKTASTGLIFSSSSMAQKFGGAIGGAAVLWLLSAAGYVTDGSVAFGAQPESAISCLWLLMSFIPAIVSALSVCVVWFYPLTTKRVEEIVEKLKVQRAQR
jgi:GPH family glycoside/pentoside/hexuronide:cation symporter